MSPVVRRRYGALAVVGVVALGCGGSIGEAPASCLTLHPCGGDLVGTWRFVGACVADTATFTAFANARCAGSTVSGYSLAASGSITFNADLTYSARDWKTSFTQMSTFPASCTPGSSCAEQSLSVTLSNGGFSNTTCSGSDVCACSQSGLNAITETGTYTASGFEFHLDGPTGGRGTSPYCVEGRFLHIIEEDVTSADPTVPLIVVADSVAIRQ